MADAQAGNGNGNGSGDGDGLYPDGQSGDAAADMPALDLCGALDCGDGACDGRTGGCICPAGQFFDGSNCADVQPCLADGSCDGLCPIPRAPVLDILRADELLRFATVEGATLEVGVAADPAALQPDAWQGGDALDLSEHAGFQVRVFARIAEADCTPVGMFNAVYDVRDDYPGGAAQPGSPAIARGADSIVGWASEVVDFVIGGDVGPEWVDAQRALGPAEGTVSNVVSLGNGGVITLGFDVTIADGEGPEVAVFENGFSADFLELATVEVSSDGEHFAAFDAANVNEAPVGSHETLAPESLHGFAGAYERGFGSPFDLAQLRQHPHVVTGQLDLSAVIQVRVVDVVGDGGAQDSFARPVYDPYPNAETAGFDLDAVAVVGAAPR